MKAAAFTPAIRVTGEIAIFQPTGSQFVYALQVHWARGNTCPYHSVS
jgi:hypothetical protein